MRLHEMLSTSLKRCVRMCSTTSSDAFVFSAANFANPDLPGGLSILDVPLTKATDESLQGFGRLSRSRDEYTVASNNFEIVPWPRPTGARPLDEHTGDEAGTVEGEFAVKWDGDFYLGENKAIESVSNTYLDGLGAPPEDARRGDDGVGSGDAIHLWMSDFHPDGAQSFWPMLCGEGENETASFPFVVCLGKACEDVTPADMHAFYVPPGCGVYLDPGTWHNGVYVAREHAPATFLTRQGRVHARVSCSWASEFNTLLRVPLRMQEA